MIYFEFSSRKSNTNLPKEKKIQFESFSSLPPEDGPIDDYARAAQATEDDCNSIYSEKCRFSLLGLLMSKDRPTF